MDAATPNRPQPLPRLDHEALLRRAFAVARGSRSYFDVAGSVATSGNS
jgi:hypothetical protein